MNGQILALWGAVLSTILGAIKIWEVWRDRHRIDIGYTFCGDEQRGNTITIRNVSARPLILSHWELQLRQGRWPRPRYNTFKSQEPDEVTDIRIEPFSSHPLVFSEADYFDWTKAPFHGGPLYIRLHFAGRRPTRLLAYPGT